MNSRDVMETIQALTDIPGVSGWEDPVREEIIRRLPKDCQYQVDPLGNLLVEKKGQARPKNKILLSAHMDEVGFIVTHVEDSGLLRFDTVGGIDSRVILGKAVEIGEKRVYGVIGSKAVHHQEESERNTPQEPGKLFIDIGASNREQAEAVVSPGDRAIFHAPFVHMNGGKLLGRAMDDRAGCAILLELLHKELPWDCTVAFTVQEETGCTGGATAGYGVNPDISLVVETTTAADIAGTDPGKVVCRLGKGPVLSFMDKGAIYDRELYRLATQKAKEADIPCQAKEGVFGGNEARSIQVSREGVRVLAVSLPCRYLHAPAAMLQEEDIHSTLKLLAQLVDAFAEL